MMELDRTPIKDSLEGEQIEYLEKKQHEYKHVGKLRKVPGHSLFSFNRKTQEIKLATFERKVSVGLNGQPIYETQVVVEADCFYEQALNIKNFVKRLKRYGFI